MLGRNRRRIVASFVVAGLALLALLGAAIFQRGIPNGVVAQAALALIAVVGVAALWHAYEVIAGHYKSLERLRGAVVTLSGDPSAVLPPLRGQRGGVEVEHLHAALTDLAARDAARRALPDQRLGAVLASISEAIVVVTEQGLVSLVNYAAKQRLGAERIKVGTSIFAALLRAPYEEAFAAARGQASPISVALETVDGVEIEARFACLDEHGGAVLSIACDAREHRAEVEHDLELHDLPPPAQAPQGETPLADMAALVLDCETTGLDVAQDRVVSIGAVRLHGPRIYRSTTFDRLVNPGLPIPPRSTAVHGITDAMVAEAESFAPVFAALEPLQRDTVMIGHNIPFDIAMLERECRRAAVDWVRPLFLDTLLLAALLEPSLQRLDLEDLAGQFGVEIRGRHTALGDSLVTAEVYRALLPRLQARGVTTLAAARDFSERAQGLIKRQKQMGW